MKTKKHRTEKSWLATRQKLITGSDAPSIAGLFEEGGYGDDRYTLWARKTGKLPQTGDKLRFDVGHHLEEFIAQRASEALQRPVVDPGEYTIFLNDGSSWLGCTIDRLFVRPTEILELKTISSAVKKDWATGPNLYTKIQVIHQSLTTDIEEAWAAALIGLGESLVIHQFEVTNDMREMLYDLEYRFYHDHIKPDIPPPIGKGDRSKETLLALFPEAQKGVGVDLPVTPEIISAARMYRRRKEQQKMLKAALRLVEKDIVEQENQLKVEMGDAEFGELPGATYKWASSPRKGYVVEPTIVRTFKEVKK